MLVLLDECLPVRLRHHIEGHDVRTAEFMGWKGVKIGTLLGLMRDAGIEVLVTIDANLEVPAECARQRHWCDPHASAIESHW